MAELLIHRYGRGNPNDDSDWQPLDIVVVKEDGWLWGSREVGPGTSFILVRLPGVPVEEIAHLVSALDSADPAVGMSKRRRRKLNVPGLPTQLRNAITDHGDGTYTVSVDEVTLNRGQTTALLAAVQEKP